MEKKMRHLKRSVLSIAGIVMLALLPILGLPDTWTLYIFFFFIYLTMANMWNLLSGYCGLISLCQPAFIGLGGYMLVIATWNEFSVWTGIIAGAIVSVIFCILISTAVFKLRGIYFAIGTLVVPEALRVIFLNWRPVGDQIHGKGAGYMLKGIENLNMNHIYWLALFVGIISILVMRYILSSKLGMGLAAIRDNDDAASSSGINIYMLKLIAFSVSALITSIAGAIFFVYQGYISPTASFSMNWTMIVILSTVIGGISTEEGPFIGAAIIILLHFLLARAGGVSMIIQGLLLIIIMLLAPYGIMGFVRKTNTYNSLLSLVGVGIR